MLPSGPDGVGFAIATGAWPILTLYFIIIFAN